MGYLTGKMDANMKLDPKTDLRTTFDRFSAENMAANMPVVELLKRFAEKNPHAFPNCPRMADGPEAVHRLDIRYAQCGPSERELGSAQCSVNACGPE
jgi:hypothetical protein